MTWGFIPIYGPGKGGVPEMSSKIALVLFLFLSPALAWPQTAVSDPQSGPAQGQQTEQSGSIRDSTAQADAGTQSEFWIAVTTPVPVPVLAGQETENSGGKQQTKRMFWVVPNFAAVSADTKLPPLSVREKFALARQDSVDYSSFVWAGLQAGQSMALIPIRRWATDSLAMAAIIGGRSRIRRLDLFSRKQSSPR